MKNSPRVALHVAAVLVCLCACTAPAADTFRWDFLDATNYDFDEALIEVDTNGTGYARLLLQAEVVNHASAADYAVAERSLSLDFGSDVAIVLAGDGGSFPVYGEYTSGLIDGGEGNDWQTIRIAADHGDFLHDASIISYYKMDNDAWLDSISGNQASVYGAPSFTTDAKIGTHSGRFRGTPTDYLFMPGSNPFTSRSTCSIAFWLKIDDYV
ncbi:hypothetical protein ACFLSJ_08280, partial [Verrucomicrobiota bacterium]